MRSVDVREVDGWLTVKTGKISKHTSTIKGKKYSRGKIYLPDDSFTGRQYRLIDIGIKRMSYEAIDGSRLKGIGYILLIEL